MFLRLFRSPSLLWGVAALLILSQRFQQMTEVPWWDAAFGVFPAAIYLQENGFDIWTLSSEPVFLEGGPNVYPRSLVTLLTALVLTLFGFNTFALVLLHLLHMACAAATVMMSINLMKPLCGQAVAVLAGLCTLLCPLFLTQAGHMYLEIPLALCTVGAINAWSQGSFKRALIWASVAVWIKHIGIIVPAALAIGVLLEPLAHRVRAWRIAALGTPVIAMVGSELWFATGDDSYYSPGPLSELIQGAYFTLSHVPDLLVVVAMSIVIALCRLPAAMRAIRVGECVPVTEATVGGRRQALISVVILLFLAFFLVVSRLVEVALIPRYFVMIWPLMVASIVTMALRVLPKSCVGVVLIGAVSLFVVNRRGLLYPYLTNNYASLAERSFEYEDLLAVQKEGVAALYDVPAHLPVYYGLPEHYYVSYPAMGYVDAKLPNGRCVLFDEKVKGASLEAFPDHFFVLLNFPLLGGEHLARLKLEAERAPWWEVKTTSFIRGYAHVRLLEFRRLIPRSKP